MRIIQSIGFYFPDSVGGSEVYVNALANKLQSSGIECIVAAPHQSNETLRYVHSGIEVFRYPFPMHPRRDEVQGRVAPRHFSVFERWLRDQRATVYHQHSWTTGCGSWHLEAAKQLGLKTIVTMHVPTTLCMRGTMLHEGRAACNGEIIPQRCASCWLQSKGLKPTLAHALAGLPQSLNPLTRLPGIGPALAAKALAANRLKNLHGMFAAADRVIAVCGWLRDALIANRMPSRKIVLNRQGVGDGEKIQALPREGAPHVLRFGFLGRWDPIKGVHLLVEAFKCLPRSLAVELRILAFASGIDGNEYANAVRRSAVGDPRIHFLPGEQKLASAEFLAGIDMLIVPSQCLETGPLVVLEAFAAGIPVIGSNLGGIMELISHEKNGLLVPHDDVKAWAASMARLEADRELVKRLRQGVGPVRTMSEVAHEMSALYRELLAI